MKKVVYTCLFSNGPKRHDEPLIKDENKLDGYDYVIFTNIPDKIANSGWTPIYKDLINDHAIYTSKYYKWCSHKYLLDYDICIFVDAYMMPKPTINWSPYELKLNDENINDACVIMKHPQRICIYKECDAIVACKKDTRANMDRVVAYLKENNMPANYGLTENGLFMRHLKNEKFNVFCEEFYNLMSQYSYRDQSFLSYMFWKYDVTIHVDFTRQFLMVSGKIGDHAYV